MHCYFENSSKQKKFLVETDYTEDIIDVMEGFFEEHGHRPHVLIPVMKDNVLRIGIESGCEAFVIDEINEEQADELLAELRA